MGVKIASGDKALYIGQLPGRKSIALAAVEGSVIHRLCYFKTEADAERFKATLLDMLESAGGRVIYEPQADARSAQA